MAGQERGRELPAQETVDYRRIFDVAPEGIVLFDRSLRVVDCNDAFAKLVESSRERIVGLELRHLREQRHAEPLRRALAGETVMVDGPYQATTSDALTWLAATVGPFADDEGRIIGVVALVRDRTAQMRAETLAWYHAERIAGVGSWLWDIHAGRTTLSPELLRVLGMEPPEARECHGPEALEPLLDPADRARFRDELHDVLARRLPYSEAEFRIRRSDGTRWICIRSEWKYAEPNGQPVAAWGTIHDITQRRALEEQLRQSQKMQAIGQLAGGIAHDFSNILTVIAAYAGMLEEALKDEPSVSDDVREIRSAAGRGTALIRKLLAVSRDQALAPVTLDVNEVVNDVTRMLRPLLGADVEIATHLHAGLWPVFADRGQVEQVVMNLLVNARDAMPEGGVITIRTANTGAAPRSGGEGAAEGLVALVVRDTGMGMSAATREHIFEPFFTTKPAGRGTGLGLSTVYGIVKQSGGDIAVASEPGKGATFTVYLPRHASAPARIEDAALPARAATVLVAEDEPAIRRLVRRLLEGEGYRVLDAADGQAALDILAREGASIDLVITDAVMPIVDGRVLTERLEREYPHIAVLCVTGYSAEEATRRGIPPAVSVLRKPFSNDELLSAVAAAIGRVADAGDAR